MASSTDTVLPSPTDVVVSTPKAVTNIENRIKAFEAIQSFCNDLWSIFGQPKAVTPFTLYHRLLERITVEQYESVQKVLTGFERFFVQYDKLLTTDEIDTIPVGTLITYGDNQNVAIEIQKCLHKADDSLISSIRSHLLTISALLFPNKDNLGRLEAFRGETKDADGEEAAFKIDTTTAEGAFISGVMEKARGALQDTDMSNPTNAVMGIARSGIFNDMMTSFSSGQANGQKLDPRRMMRVMQKAMNSMMPPGEDD